MTDPRQFDAPIRILLVDDEVSYANALAKRMKLRGLEPTTVNSGREAIQRLRGDDFHVALLDLKMEDVDGIETLKVFRIMDPHLKVIILTGHGGEAEARQCMKLGAEDYLIKPCEFETVLKKVTKAADKRRAELRAEQPQDD